MNMLQGKTLLNVKQVRYIFGGNIMLKDLSYYTTKPSQIYAMIAQINGIDLSCEKDYFEHYTIGVYRHDGYMCNFDGFIEERCENEINDRYVKYGVCDNYEQVLEKYKDILNDTDKNYVIGMCTIDREKQPTEGGWRWHKWGEYIGNQNPEHEYLYDDTHIDRVYCFHIYEID